MDRGERPSGAGSVSAPESSLRASPLQRVPSPRPSLHAPRSLLLTDPAARLVIAHRGASAYAPENTLEAFALGLEMGADALELDVRLTSDGAVVVHHDPTPLRTAGDARPVATLALGVLQSLDAGARFTADGGTFPWRDRGVRVPTLDAVLARFPATPLLIEVKEAHAALATRDAIARAGAEDRCVVASSIDRALDPFRQGRWLRGAATGDVARLYFPAVLGLPRPRVTACAFSVPERWKGLPIPTRRFVRAARDAGASVHVWTVDDPERASDLWARGVAGIVTNRPDVIVRVRDERR